LIYYPRGYPFIINCIPCLYIFVLEAWAFYDAARCLLLFTHNQSKEFVARFFNGVC